MVREKSDEDTAEKCVDDVKIGSGKNKKCSTGKRAQSSKLKRRRDSVRG